MNWSRASSIGRHAGCCRLVWAPRALDTRPSSHAGLSCWQGTPCARAAGHLQGKQQRRCSHSSKSRRWRPPAPQAHTAADHDKPCVITTPLYYVNAGGLSAGRHACLHACIGTEILQRADCCCAAWLGVSIVHAHRASMQPADMCTATQPRTWGPHTPRWQQTSLPATSACAGGRSPSSPAQTRTARRSQPRLLQPGWLLSSTAMESPSSMQTCGRRWPLLGRAAAQIQAAACQDATQLCMAWCRPG